MSNHHRFWGVHVGPEDHCTSTVDGAAYYERTHSVAWDMDEPSPEEYAGDEEWAQEQRDRARTPRPAA